MQSEYQKRESALPNPEILRHAERQIYLGTIDKLWMEHLENMQSLREKVSLRGFGQRDPLVEYKNEAFIEFEQLLGNIRGNTILALFKLRIESREPTAPLPSSNIPSDIRTNESKVEDIVTGDREEFTPDEQRKIAANAKKFLKVNPQIQNLGRDGVGQIRADDAPPPAVAANPTVVRADSNSPEQKTVGRNDPCPCGSGKKFKKCCGAEN